MRQLLLLSFGALLCVLFAGLALSMSSQKLPVPEGKAVIDYITTIDDYRQWDLWPGKKKLFKGQHPHGSLLTIYVSAEAVQAIKRKVGVLPNGSMVVKENYTAENNLDAITLMYKSEGYNSEAGDWFWLEYSLDGKIKKEGKVGGCIACHAMVKGNDWLFAGPLK